MPRYWAVLPAAAVGDCLMSGSVRGQCLCYSGGNPYSVGANINDSCLGQKVQTCTYNGTCFWSECHGLPPLPVGATTLFKTEDESTLGGYCAFCTDERGAMYSRGAHHGFAPQGELLTCADGGWRQASDEPCEDGPSAAERRACAVREITAGTTVPSLRVTDVNAKQVTIAYASYPPTVVYVFAPGCGWCALNVASIRALLWPMPRHTGLLGSLSAATG